MKIRSRLTLAVLACLLPIWIGFGIITGVARTSDRAKTLALIEEYTGSVVTSLQVFFDEATELASYIAALRSEVDVEWTEGGSSLVQSLVRRKPSLNDAGWVDENGYCYLASVPGNPWQGGRMTVNDSDPNAEPVTLAGSDYWTTYIEGNRGETDAFVVEPYIPDGYDFKVVVTGAPVMRDGRCVGASNVMQTLPELSSLYSELTEHFNG